MTTAEEKVETLQARINALKQEQKKQQKIVNKKKRNARTKRLIEIGAVVESALDAEVPKEDLPKLKEFLIRHKNDYSQTAPVVAVTDEPPF